jgi:hypothetical protein
LPARARLDWQQTFVTSATRRRERARAKLTRILPDGCAPLAHLDGLARLLGTTHVPASVSENAWLYLANAFDQHGCGLFVEPAVENLAIAQDYVMAQSVIPAVRSRWAKTPEMGETIGEYLAPRLPRAYTQWGTRLHPV